MHNFLKKIKHERFNLIQRLRRIIFFLLIPWLSIWTNPGSALGVFFKAEPVKQVNIDTLGLPLRFPYAMAYDDKHNELYVVTGGRAQIIVYANDMFPVISLGSGRDVYTPQGAFVDQDGMIYVCQLGRDGRSNRITILNAAFIVVQEIPLDDIPGVESFSPRRVAVSQNGLIYVASNHRGVLVLNKDGTFQRWLKAVDHFSRRPSNLIGEEQEAAEEIEDAQELSDVSEKEQLTPEPEIPEEFKKGAQEDQPGMWPVRIQDVRIDDTGNIYLLSNEKGKVYVFNQEESFLFSFGDKGGAPGKLSQPRSVAIDRNLGLMYVVDYMRHTILAYDQAGKFQFEFGGKGAAPGWFLFPTDLLVNQDGQLIICDLHNHRLQVFNIQYQVDYPGLEELQTPASSAIEIYRSSPSEKEEDKAESDSESRVSDRSSSPQSDLQEDIEAFSDPVSNDILEDEERMIKETIVPDIEVPAFRDE